MPMEDDLDALGLISARSRSAVYFGPVDAGVALFADDATVGSVALGQPFVGRDAIRVWAQTLIDGHFHTTVEVVGFTEVGA